MRLLVYPYNKQLSPFFRYREMLNSYDSVTFVSPKGFGIDNMDPAICDGTNPTQIKISSDFNKALLNCDSVLIDKTSEALSAESYCEKIQRAVSADKFVMVTGLLADYIRKADIELPYTDKIQIVGYNEKNILLNHEIRLLDLPVPCVFILGTGNNCNKFELQLGIRKAFLSAGYKVTQLGTKEYSALFGFDPLPKFLFEPGDQKKKILDFNHYLYELVKREQSDVVILSAPGGIMQVNPFEFDEYGELGFVLGNAVKADIGVLGLYCAPYTEVVLENSLNICRYRLNTPVEFLSLAGNDLSITNDEMLCKYLTIPTDYILSEVIPKVDYPQEKIFASLNKDSVQSLGQAVIKSLEENI